MAGLLDLFSGGPSPYAGLLNAEQQDAINNRGLAAYAAALGQAAGPSRMPVSIGQALGQASMASMQAQDQGAEGAFKAQMMGLQANKLKREDEQAGELDKLRNEAVASLGTLGSPGGIQLPAGLTPQMAQFMARSNPAAFLQALQKDETPITLGPDQELRDRRDPTKVLAKGGGGKPIVQTFHEGGMDVSKQWDPDSRAWVEVSRGPRWQPDQTLVEIVDPNDKSRTIMVPRHLAVGQEGKGAYGMVMMPNPRDPNGPPILMQGNAKMLGNLPGMLTQGAQTKTQEALLDMTALNAQMTDIIGRFKPEYQQLGTRGNVWWSSLKDKAGLDLSPEDRAKVTDFAQYRASAGQFYADRLKAMAGSAVTDNEAKRQDVYLPVVGTGVFDGDSPTEFKAKSDRMHQFFNNATARLYYITQKGLSIKDVDSGKAPGLDDMPRIIRERGNAVAKELEAKGLQGDALKAAVKQQIGREFGLVSD